MNVAGESRTRGSEVDVEGDVASYLLEQGRAELVRGDAPVIPERAASRERTRRQRPIKRSSDAT